MTGAPRPPRLPTWLLDRVLPAGTAGRSIRGDLVQEYHERRANRRGAVLWFTVEACKLALRYGVRPQSGPGPRGRGHGARHRWRAATHAVWIDGRHGVRLLRRKPMMAAVTVLTLALGIGINAAVFAVVDGVLIRPLPFENPDRVVRVFAHDPETGDRFQPATVLEYEQYRGRSRVFDDLAAYSVAPRDLRDGAADTQTLTIGRATRNLFDMLGVSPVVGRSFHEDDTRTDRRVTMLTYRFWRSTYGGRTSVLGRTVEIGEEPYTVIGVLPPGFDHPPNLAVWRPLTGDEYRDDDRELTILGRLTPDVSILEADRELGAIAAGLHGDHPGEAAAEIHVEPFYRAIVRGVRAPLLAIWAAAGCILLIACTNLASLQLAQTAAREHELALRTALGAGRGRLVSQVLTESLIVALPAAAIGIAAGYVAHGLLIATVPGETPRLVEVGFNLRVIVAMVVLAMAGGVAIGLIPAILVGRAGLRDSGVGGRYGRRRPMLQYGLVAGQLAVSTVLAVGAALLLGSFSRQMDFDRGFEPNRLLAVTVDPPGDFASAAAGLEFFEEVVRRVAALPAVETATMASTSPMNPRGFRSTIDMQPAERPSGAGVDAFLKVVFGDFFVVTRTALLAGRTFDSSDQRASESVIIVNRALARALGLGDRQALGRTVTTRLGAARIVGVVRDIQPSAAEPPAPTAYLSYRQVFVPTGVLLARTSGSAASVAPSIRAILREMDPTMPLNRFTTIDEEIGETVAQPRFNALIVAAFAALSIVLAAVGAYGVTSHLVRSRHREMGIRQALGATPGQLTWTVLATGIRVIAIGGMIGLIAAYWLSRLLRSLLFGIDASSAAGAAAAVAALAGATLLAWYIPARRTAQVPPVVALRND